MRYALCGLVLLSACANPRSTPNALTLQRFNAPLPVPFIAQKPNYCGPAALAMLANYYGHDVSQDEIASSIYLPEIHGALTTDLAEYAQQFGLFVRQYGGSLRDLERKLAKGIPLIVLGRFGKQYHYFVVLAVDRTRDVIVAHSDTRPRVSIRREDFLRYWSRANRWTMLVCPAEHATWKLSAAEHNDLGVYYERAGHLDEAAEHYAIATASDPKAAYVWVNLGNVMLKQRKLRDAAVCFAEALEREPDNADAMNNLAFAYFELGETLDRAAELCRRAIALRPSRRAYYLDTLGSILLKQGKNGEAVAAYEEALAATTDRQASLRAEIEKRLAAARALVEK